MTVEQLLTLFRSEMADQAEPYLWSDEEFFVYLDDAQKMWARLTDGIADASSDLTQIEIVAGQQWYDLDQRVLKVRTATRLDDGRTVDVLNPEMLKHRGVVFAGHSGPLKVLVQGLEDFKLRAWPIPVADVTVELAVFRLPLNDIVDDSSELEIAPHHHYHLLKWVRAKAYGKQDADTFDRIKAGEFEASFREYCESVQREQSRVRRSTGTVQYGGI